jgi:hypothetical protein
MLYHTILRPATRPLFWLALIDDDLRVFGG